MGGYGSGRTEGWGRCVVEDARILDVDRLTQEGVVAPDLWRSGSWLWLDAATGERVASIGYEVETGTDAGSLRVHYTITNHESGRPWPMDYRLELVTTRPHFGGVRWWLLCPLSGRRVRKLYANRSSDYFASRAALGLTYRSCRENEMDRALRKTQKILCDRLGGTGALDEVHWLPKPKGMHWRTYSRLMMDAGEASDRSWAGLADQLRAML
jgi:hypothetical protein